MKLGEVAETAFTRATPENIDRVMTARFGLLGIFLLPFILAVLGVFLIGQVW